MLLYNGWELRLRLENNSGGQVQPEADPPLAETCLRLRRVVDSSSGARLPAGAAFWRRRVVDRGKAHVCSSSCFLHYPSTTILSSLLRTQRGAQPAPQSSEWGQPPT